MHIRAKMTLERSRPTADLWALDVLAVNYPHGSGTVVCGGYLCNRSLCSSRHAALAQAGQLVQHKILGDMNSSGDIIRGYQYNQVRGRISSWRAYRMFKKHISLLRQNIATVSCLQVV